MRGRVAEVGQTNIAANGYHYTRTETGWRLTHHIIAERVLGRSLRPGERVKFKDGDRSNRHPDNLEVYVVQSRSKEARAAVLRAKIEALQAELEELESENKDLS